jgi:hypothetical protein
MFIKFMTEYVMQKIEKLLLVKVFKSVSKWYLVTITQEIKKESEYISNILTQIFGMC